MTDKATKNGTGKASGKLPCYRNYLSFGGGVNSVALYLLMEQLGIEFEAIFVDHGADYPETYEYVNYFIATGRPITVLKPEISRPFRGGRKTWNTLVDYCKDREIIPQQWPRWCTRDWKKDVVSKYVKKPCFMMIGIDAGESHRAKITSKGKIEYRWPLIEEGVDREGCKNIIKKAGLKIPPKSGCFICPFQRPDQWRKLRREHPNLFCVAKNLEVNSGRMYRKGWPLERIINKEQTNLWPEMDYPPCQCGL